MESPALRWANGLIRFALTANDSEMQLSRAVSVRPELKYLGPTLQRGDVGQVLRKHYSPAIGIDGSNLNTQSRTFKGISDIRWNTRIIVSWTPRRAQPVPRKNHQIDQISADGDMDSRLLRLATS